MSPRLTATARREQILDVALEVFATHGFHGASMNDVADAVGVTKPVLYQHFDSKRDLYQALIDEVGDRLLANIAKAAAEATDGKSQTDLGFRAYFRWVADDHDAFRFLFGSGTRRDDEFNAAVTGSPPRRQGGRAADRGRHRRTPSHHHRPFARRAWPKARAACWSSEATSSTPTRSPRWCRTSPGPASAPSNPRTDRLPKD
jgi:AcrR family transcriptional regulator